MNEWICAKCKKEHWRMSDGNCFYFDKDDWDLDETKFICKSCYKKAQKFIDEKMHEIYEQNKIGYIKEWLNDLR